MKLYQILIPLADNKGRDFSTKVREDFFKEVNAVAGGVTLPGNSHELFGTWTNQQTGKLVVDKSGPILVAVETKHQLQQIMTLARTTFEQDSIMAWLVSEEVIFNEDSGN